MADISKGACFCGAVEIEVEGAPMTQGYCHCNGCRAWTAQPVVAFALWPTPMVRVTKGADRLGRASRNDNLTVRFCTACGGNVMVESIASGYVDVFPMIIEDFDFQPVSHVNYGDRRIDLRDGLPKFRGMPAEAGGTGEMMAE